MDEDQREAIQQAFDMIEMRKEAQKRDVLARMSRLTGVDADELRQILEHPDTSGNQANSAAQTD